MFFYIQRFYKNIFFLQIYTYIYIFTVVKCIVVYGSCAMPKKKHKINTPRICLCGFYVFNYYFCV